MTCTQTMLCKYHTAQKAEIPANTLPREMVKQASSYSIRFYIGTFEATYIPTGKKGFTCAKGIWIICFLQFKKCGFPMWFHFIN